MAKSKDAQQWLSHQLPDDMRPSGSRMDARSFKHAMPKMVDMGVTIAYRGTSRCTPMHVFGWTLNFGPCPCGNHDRALHVAISKGLN